MVQLGCALLAVNSKAVVVGKSYSGGASDPLTIAIKHHEKRRGGTQDGKVSPIKSGTGAYDSQHIWIVLALSNNIKTALGANWPHLDRHPLCPAEHAAASKRTFAE